MNDMLTSAELIEMGTSLSSRRPDESEGGQVFLTRIDPRFQPVWAESNPAKQKALSLYFLPHRSQMLMLQPTRPRVIKWYCPFAHHCKFPSGHRYCINVYTGCSHDCAYCYAASYQPAGAQPKREFGRMLQKDLDDLDRFDVPAAPVHLSNSTDPFQPLELTRGHTKLALEGILRHRHRFTTVTVLTKNPLLASRSDYLSLFRSLGEIPADHPAKHVWQDGSRPAFQVEVSLAFWREEARAFWDSRAPAVAARGEGIRALREAGVPVVMRIDPLFPRSPVSDGPLATLRDFELDEAQTLEDLEQLVLLAKQLGVRHVVYSPVKIVQPRRRPMDSKMARLRALYEAMAHPENLGFRGGSWRLPARAAATLTEPFLELCQKCQVPATFCMMNLIQTP